MLPYRDSRMTQIALGIFFVAIIAYGYFEARGLLYGPTISVPGQVQEVHEQFVHIKGTADRIASLTMNGNPIVVTESGAFDQPYLLAPGLNRIILDAKDKYGRTRQEVIQIVYTPTGTPTTTPSTATSTNATITASSTSTTTSQ